MTRALCVPVARSVCEVWPSGRVTLNILAMEVTCCLSKMKTIGCDADCFSDKRLSSIGKVLMSIPAADNREKCGWTARRSGLPVRCGRIHIPWRLTVVLLDHALEIILSKCRHFFPGYFLGYNDVEVRSPTVLLRHVSVVNRNFHFCVFFLVSFAVGPIHGVPCVLWEFGALIPPCRNSFRTSVLL